MNTRLSLEWDFSVFSSLKCVTLTRILGILRVGGGGLEGRALSFS
jgi:hypothetical protein